MSDIFYSFSIHWLFKYLSTYLSNAVELHIYSQPVGK